MPRPLNTGKPVRRALMMEQNALKGNIDFYNIFSNLFQNYSESVRYTDKGLSHVTPAFGKRVLSARCH